MYNNELPLSQISKAEVYLLHNGINPDSLAPADIAQIQKELEASPCEITFKRSSEQTGDKSEISEEEKVLTEEFFSKFSITPDKAPPVIRSMAEDIAKRAISNGYTKHENGFVNSTELSPGVEFEL